ncbi:hypothetical protein LOTGIDRAFT_232470 [Lottia gigantea]|uniref:SH3 domain-containing protein n=1 Tax=Lottia gigantea TaxID=225164 RepID=V3ZS10_LOTGI|nr:hypothetical protein LOTGIDRAFT_232470 [Lottia gigantea]ESO94223.1 hypothetical protein LOTGIDRAFT_232470 [Lottia gigantea]
MPKTDASPLSIVQKQAEVTKKAVEKLVKECNKVIKDKKLKDKDVKQKQLFKECFQLKKDVLSVHDRAEKLTKEDEPKKVKNYDNKKDFEVKRLANLQNQLTMIMPKLAPEEDEEAFTKELKEAGEISDTPVNEEEEEEEESEEEDEADNAVTQENQGEIKDSPKDEKKGKDKEKKGKDKHKKDKDKKGKDKDKKKKDKDDKEEDEDEDDEEADDKDAKAKDKKNKDKKDGKSKDKKEKDKKDKKKKNEVDEEEEDDEEDKKKSKDKKKDKDKKEKDKVEKKNKKEKVEAPRQEVKDLEEESDEEEEDEEEEDEDIEEAIEGDDEEDFEETEDEEEDHAVVKSVRKQDAKQVQAKTSPKDETDYVETMEYVDEESEEEEDSDDDDVEDMIQPEKAKVIASTPKPASRTLTPKSESSKTASSTTVLPSSSSENKTESSNIVSSASQSKTPQPASRSSTSKASSSSSKEVSKIESKKDEADHEDDEEDEDESEEEEEEEEEGEVEEESEEEDDEDEEEEESDEEDTTKAEDTLEVTQGIERFVAIDDFEAVEKGDLSVKKDEVIRIIEVREDGWWIAENDAGKQGLVPKTYLKVYNQYSSLQQHDEEEKKEHSEEEGEEKQDGEKTPHSKRRSGRELWGSLKKTVNETLVTDVLHAMGAGPPGFRLPTLSKYFNESEKFRMKNFLSPKLSESNLGYRDLLFNPATGEMRAVEVRLERVITITSCQQIPPPATGIIVQRRYVRMCLFDGQNVLSNIHTIRVAAEDKTERNWSFNSKISDLMDVQLHNEFFIRSNSTNSNIGVLFELCISCVKSKSEERGEFSCGWVHLPLTDKTGVPIANKNYDLYVHGGTPYERDVEVDPSVSRREFIKFNLLNKGSRRYSSSNALVSLISGNKQPRLLVKVSVPNKEQKTQLDLLPEILVGDMCLLPFYTYYRQILADALIIKRLDLDSTEVIHSPFLRQFPKVADNPDLMSLFRETWVNKLKAVKRAEKRDVEAMKGLLDKVFKESVYPVITTGNFVPYKTGNTEIEMKRKNVIEKFSQIKRERKSALAALLASDIVYTPFDMSEVTFNIINPYSLADKFIPIPVES